MSMEKLDVSCKILPLTKGEKEFILLRKHGQRVCRMNGVLCLVDITRYTEKEDE